VATEQDAARDRVLAARAELREEVELLEASGRAAIDIPARIKRSPAKAAAIAGGLGFVILKGPQRLFGVARRKVRGEPADLPDRMLPEEVEKTLRKLGRDGDKVRGALERDFADYAKKSHKEREGLKSVLLLAVARPLLARGAKAAGDLLMSPDREGFSDRLAQVRARAEEGADKAREGVERAGTSAKDRIAAVRRDDADPTAPADETAPTGI
jgi:hypothetical protein